MNDIPDKRPVSKNPEGGADTSKHEIDLSDYIGVVWRRKYSVVFGAVCPALLFWLILFFSPRDYCVTYTYDIGPDARTYRALLGQFQDRDSPYGAADRVEKAVLSEKERRILFERFYSAEKIDKLTAVLSEKERRILFERFYSVENQDRLAAKLRENGFEEYARAITQTKIRLEVSDTSLAVTMTGRRAEDVQAISSTVRDNLEKVIPMYCVKEHLSGEVARIKTEMADIEEGRFRRELEVERKKAILARLKTLVSTEAGVTADGLILHFENMRESTEYLPPSYQAQAVDANIIYIEETINADQEKYSYYGKLQSLDEMLLEEIRNKTSSYYTIEEFHSFLTRIAGDYEGSELRHYLSAYVKRIENVISASAPIFESPGVSPVPKGSLKKTGIVFVALLMVTTFGAFLLEAAQKSRKPGFVKSS